MSNELMSLTAVTVFTAILWMPYVLNMIAIRGVRDAVGYPDDPAPLSPWAQKMKAAHANAVENLVVFATLVLVANAVGVTSDATVLACQVYFWARVAHALTYTFAIPLLRTLAFVIGFGCQMVLALALL